MYKITIAILTSLLYSYSIAQKNTSCEPLRNQLYEIIKPYHATVGISVLHLENDDTLSINNNKHYPMQSVYKFPLALYIMHQIDLGKLSLNQKIRVTKEDVKIKTWSPIRDKFPEGNVDITVAELLEATVSQSDNVGCDVLFKLVNGPKKVNQYIHKIGVQDISIANTESEMAKQWQLQYDNWSKPSSTTTLLKNLFYKKYLSDSSTNFLMELLIKTSTGSDRLKGMLPSETVVAHKTGTSGTNDDGITAAVNDVGIITLPNGNHIVISVFVSNSKESLEMNSEIIAAIAKNTYDYYLIKNPSLEQSK